MVNLEWYRTFKAIYQTGSVTAAAKVLFISQPNVSQHLSALEAHVGKQLFERKPKFLATDYGKLFYTQVVEPLEKLEDVETEFRAICLSKKLPLLRLGSAKEYFHAVSSRYLTDLPAQLKVSFGLTKDLIQKLLKEELDFVIATQHGQEQGIVYEPILTEHFTLVGDAGIDTSTFNEYLQHENWTAAEQWLLQQTWFAYSPDLAIIRRFWLNNFEKRPAIKPAFIIPDMNTILQAISNGKGISIAANYLTEALISEQKIKTIWTGRRETSNTLYLAYDQSKVSQEQIKIMNDLLKRSQQL